MNNDRQPRFELRSHFLKDFTGNYWCKKPTVIRSGFENLVTQNQEIFESLVRAKNLFLCNPERESNLFRFYVDRKRAYQSEIEDWIPSKKDGSLEDYIARLEKALPKKEFGIIVNSFQHINLPIWNNIRHFLKTLYQQVGIPAGSCDLVLFISRYSNTPLGLHKDPQDIFSFVLQGKKRIRTWPFQTFFSKTQAMALPWEGFSIGNFDSIPKKRQSTVFEGQPGDIIYWPSQYWHSGEGDPNTLTISLHIALTRRTNLISKIMSSVERAQVQRFLAEEKFLEPLEIGPEEIPSQLLKVESALGRELKGKSLRRHVEREWLCRQTGFGFEPPHPNFGDINLNDTVRIYPGFQITTKLADSETLISAAGHVLSFPRDPGLLRIINHLNSGEGFKINDLILNYLKGVRKTKKEEEAKSKVRLFLRTLVNRHFLWKT